MVVSIIPCVLIPSTFAFYGPNKSITPTVRERQKRIRHRGDVRDVALEVREQLDDRVEMSRLL